MRTLHIICAGKGGVGKTLCSICSLNHYIDSGKPVLAIDLNYQNNDLANILRPACRNSDGRPLGSSGFKIAELPGIVESSLSPNFLVFPDPDGSIFGRLPWEGGLGFFKQLDSILKELKRLNGADHLPQAVIVDTNLHILNLAPSNSGANADSDEFSRILGEELTHISYYTPFIWFIWTVAMLDSTRITEHIRTGGVLRELSNINFIHNESGRWFRDENIVHVINLNAFKEIPSLKKLLFRKRTFDIEGLSKLAKAKDLDSPMDFSQFYTRSLQRLQTATTANRQEQLELVARSIGGIPIDHSGNIRDSQWRRPVNVFPIYRYEDELTGYTDDIKNRIGTDSYYYKILKTKFSRIQDIIDPFLRKLDLRRST